MAYPIPPWLTPKSNPAEEYSRGLALGANIAQERNRLQAQSEQAAMAAQVRQQEIERQALKDQQEIAITQAYQSTQSALKTRQLDQVQQALAMKTKQAASRFIAQQLFTQRVRGGEDPAKVLLEMGPQLGESLTGAAQLYKATQPVTGAAPPAVEEYAGQQFLKIPTNTGTPRYQQIQKQFGSDALKGGALESYPITEPGSTNRVKGWVAVPNSSGGLTPLRVGMPEQALAQKRMAAIEKGQFGKNILSGREPIDPKLRDAFKKAKAEYEKVKPIAEGLDEPSTGESEYEKELRLAGEALARGAPRSYVSKKFKERTGKEFP